jgi:hypothetical protein
MVVKQYIKKADIRIVQPNDCLDARFFALIGKMQDRLFQGIEQKEFIKEQYNNKKSFLKEPNKKGGKTGLNNIYNKIVGEIFNQEEKSILFDFIDKRKISPPRLIRDLGDKRIAIIGANSTDELRHRFYLGIGYIVKGFREEEITKLCNRMRNMDYTADIEDIFDNSECSVKAYYNSLMKQIVQEDILFDEKLSKIRCLIDDLNLTEKEQIKLVKWITYKYLKE